MIKQHFGRALTVGVEEELWILDGETLELTGAVETLVGGVEGRTLPGTLKTELIYHENYETRAQAKLSIFEYVEVFYNHQRRHSTIGYLSPEAFEAANN